MKNFLPFLLISILLITAFIYFQRVEDKALPDIPEIPREQISFFHYFSGNLSGGIDEMVATANSNNPDRTIVASGLDHEAFKSMIHTSLEKGNPPELFSYWAGKRVQQLVDKNQLMPIDDLWENNNLSQTFSPEITKSAATYNGKKYLLPITQHIVVFFYNKKVFDNHSLLPPKNWEDFLIICEKLQQNGITPIALGAKERWPAQFWFDYLLLRTAGPEYRSSLMQGIKKYTDPEVVHVYKTWATLLQNNYFNASANQLDWAEATNLVSQGNAAMTLMGTWATQTFEDIPFSLKPGEDYDFFPFPIMTENIPYASVGPIDGIILSRESENHVFAKEVLAYFAEQKSQKIMSTGSGALAPNISISKDFYSPFKQRLREEIHTSPHWVFNYDLATPHDIADKGMDSFNELIEFPHQYSAILKNLQKEIDQKMK